MVFRINKLRMSQRGSKAAHRYQPTEAEHALLSIATLRHDWKHIFERLPTDYEQIQYCADVFFSYVGSLIRGPDHACDLETYKWVYQILRSGLKKASSFDPQVVQTPAIREESNALSDSIKTESQLMLTPTTTIEAETSSIGQQTTGQKHIHRPQLPGQAATMRPEELFEIRVSGVTFAVTDATTITVENLISIYDYKECSDWAPPQFKNLRLKALKDYIDDLGIDLSPQWKIWGMFPDGSSKPINNERVLLEVLRINWSKELAFVSVFIGPSQ